MARLRYRLCLQCIRRLSDRFRTVCPADALSNARCGIFLWFFCPASAGWGAGTPEEVADGMAADSASSDALFGLCCTACRSHRDAAHSDSARLCACRALPSFVESVDGHCPTRNSPFSCRSNRHACRTVVLRMELRAPRYAVRMLFLSQRLSLSSDRIPPVSRSKHHRGVFNIRIFNLLLYKLYYSNLKEGYL